MKLAISWTSAALTVFFALIIQELIPPVQALNGARVLLVPLVFCYAALAMPTWAMLLFAAFTGFLTDLMFLHVVDGQVEIALGWSMVYFVFFGLLAHGFQPAFLRGHWWIYVGLSIFGTCTFLALQYIMIGFRRQGIIFNDLVAWRILAPGLMAAVIAPLGHLAVKQCRHFFPDVPGEAGGYRPGQ
ncbi:MAG: hypothetical protein WCQ57_01820 [Verrucomicrobiota bacterium]